jgi:heme/copper-type cytochrome/quinol oxidase subunit 1
MIALRFLTIILTVLALLPGGAHLLELNNKIGMPEEQYYIGKAFIAVGQLIGVIWLAALFANALLAYRVRREATPCRMALAASVLLIAVFVVFFAFTFPANVATQNWTVPPPHSIELRMTWEYSHAANAIIVFAALCCATKSGSAVAQVSAAQNGISSSNSSRLSPAAATETLRVAPWAPKPLSSGSSALPLRSPARSSMVSCELKFSRTTSVV